MIEVENGSCIYGSNLKNGTLSFYSLTFINNSANNGSGGTVYVEENIASWMDTCWIVNNTAYYNDSFMNIGNLTDVYFESNTATQGSEGIFYIYNDKGANVGVTDSSFYHSNAGAGGGDLYIYDTFGGGATSGSEHYHVLQNNGAHSYCVASEGSCICAVGDPENGSGISMYLDGEELTCPDSPLAEKDNDLITFGLISIRNDYTSRLELINHGYALYEFYFTSVIFDDSGFSTIDASNSTIMSAIDTTIQFQNWTAFRNVFGNTGAIFERVYGENIFSTQLCVSEINLYTTKTHALSNAHMEHVFRLNNIGNNEKIMFVSGGKKVKVISVNTIIINNK